jgi:hypothetical protein
MFWRIAGAVQLMAPLARAAAAESIDSAALQAKLRE